MSPPITIQDKTGPRSSHSPPQVQIGRYLLPLVVLGLAVHFILPQIVSLEHSLQVIKGMALWAVSLAISAQVLSYLGSGFQLHSIVGITGRRLSIMSGMAISLAAASISLVAGGMVGYTAATYRWVSGKGGNNQEAALASTLPTFFNNGVLMLIAITGLVHLLILHDLSTAQAISLVVILFILGLIVGGVLIADRFRDRTTALAVWVGGHWARLRRKPNRPSSIETALRDMFTAWDSLRAGGWRGPALGAFINVGFDLLTLFFLFFATGYPVSLGILLAGYGLPLLLGKAAFLVPGGVGVIEASMTALYASLGVPGPIAVVVVLSYRVISFWLPFFLGFPIAAHLQRAMNLPAGSAIATRDVSGEKEK
jgi:uncharacterized protein (TIRG00374 family)